MLRKIRRVGNQARLMTSTISKAASNQVNYVGYVGRDNFGDDLLFDIYKNICGAPVRPMLDYSRFQPAVQGKVVLGGGTIIGGPIYKSALDRCSEPPSLVFCAGVIPGKIDSSWSKLLANATVLTRSIESAARLSDARINAKAFVDPAIFCREVYGDFSGSLERHIVLAPHGTHRHIGLYEALTNQMTSYERERLIWLASSWEDVGTCSQLTRRFGGKSVKGWMNVQYTLRIIANAYYVVSTRLHPSVCAASYRVPFRLISYDDKHKEFLNSIHMPHCEAHLTDDAAGIISQLRGEKRHGWNGVDFWSGHVREFLETFRNTT